MNYVFLYSFQPYDSFVYLLSRGVLVPGLVSNNYPLSLLNAQILGGIRC